MEIYENIFPRIETLLRKANLKIYSLSKANKYTMVVEDLVRMDLHKSGYNNDMVHGKMVLSNWACFHAADAALQKNLTGKSFEKHKYCPNKSGMINRSREGVFRAY